MGNNKVLITGGCGFIGPYLRGRLMEMGREVIVLDISTPQDDNASEYRVVEGDIRNAALVRTLMEGVGTVYHLAGVTEFADCRNDPMKALDINAHGTATLLREAVRCKVGNFIYFSSASVYAGSEEPVKHEDMALKPQSIYAITKLMGEKLCEDIGEKNGMTCAKLRLLNVYGKGGRGVIDKFARALDTDRRIIIYGDGRSTRDYVYISDIVEAVAAIGEKGLSGVYNIGTGEGHTVLEIKRIMEETSGISFKVEQKPREPWDPRELIADTTKIKEILPTTIPLEEGIKTLLEEVKVRKAH